MGRRLTLIAGSGALVPHVAGALQRTGEPLQIIALDKRPSLGANQMIWLDLDHPDSILAAVRDFKTSHLVLAGGVRISDTTRDKIADMFGAPGRFAGSLGDVGLAALLVVQTRLMGVTLIGAHKVAPDLLAPRGHIAGPELGADDLVLTRKALGVARNVGRLDLGQAVVMSGRRPVAAEDAAGTDALLERVAALKVQGVVGDGRYRLILAKARKPKQPVFADLPSIGPATIANAAAAGVSIIVVEAANALLIERQALLAAATANNISVYGLTAPFYG